MIFLTAKYNASSKISINNNNEGESELPIYAFDVIAKATNNFSVYNKLGQGGFGPVYKVIFFLSFHLQSTCVSAFL